MKFPYLFITVTDILLLLFLDIRNPIKQKSRLHNVMRAYIHLFEIKTHNKKR